MKAAFKKICLLGVPGIILAVVYYVACQLFGEFIKHRITMPIPVGAVVLFFCALLYAAYLLIVFFDRKMRKRKKFFDSVTAFVDENEAIHGVQFFCSERKAHNALGIDYKVTYIGGHVKSDVDTNCIMCGHYCCKDFALGRKIEKVFAAWNNFWRKEWGIDDEAKNERKHAYDVILNKFLDVYEQLLNKCQSLLNSRTDEIAESYFFYYRAMQVIAAILNDLPRVDDSTYRDTPPASLNELPPAASIAFSYLLPETLEEHGYIRPSDNSEIRTTQIKKMMMIEDQLKKGKRTGILGTILYGMPYAFNNITSPTKARRRYYCSPVDATFGEGIFAVAIFDLPPDADLVDADEQDLIGFRSTFGKLQNAVLKNRVGGVLR